VPVSGTVTVFVWPPVVVLKKQGQVEIVLQKVSATHAGDTGADDSK